MKTGINLAQSLMKTPQLLLIDASLSVVDEQMAERIIGNITRGYLEMTYCISVTESRASAEWIEKLFWVWNRKI